jgi:response regulator of citrate/malate metabolism
VTNSPMTVFVVDDDFRVASLHEAFVQRVEGFTVVGKAHTSAEALELAAALKPDLVLMDIYLPDVDGLRTLQEMLQWPSPPAAMVISAANDVVNVRSALRLGVTHSLVKPFNFAQLAERLAAFRATSAQIDELPEEATQGDINHIFDLMRPTTAPLRPELSRLAPTLKGVYDALDASTTALSASEVAENLGMSRATAQRSLTQLEQSGAIALELRYGRTGRPEHRYSIRRRAER